MLKKLSIAVALVGFAATLSAQVSPYPDTFKVNYFQNANCIDVPDATVQITNVGTQIGSKLEPSGNLCALIYVFRPDQELSECCGCRITPDGLRTISVDHDLTKNPLTGPSTTLQTGLVKIVSSLSCEPSNPIPATGVKAWLTHIQTTFSLGPPLGYDTETEFSDSNLSAGELNSLKSKCAAIEAVGSGAGKCTCGEVYDSLGGA